jgi:branched-chain amino acid transport system ATP-binding protein
LERERDAGRALLEVGGLTAGYGQRATISDISLEVERGEVVALIGHNGAGKSTSLKCIFGLLESWRGDILYNGERVTGRSPSANVSDGMSYMPQERALFPDLSVEANLEMAAYSLGKSNGMPDRLATVHSLFPLLRERAKQKANTLSGGEQRMLSFGMVLILKPVLVLLDEPSLGLGPILVRKVFDMVEDIRRTMGVSFLIVEQNIPQVLRVSDRAYVMKAGRIVHHEASQSMLQRGAWWDLF